MAPGSRDDDADAARRRPSRRRRAARSGPGNRERSAVTLPSARDGGLQVAGVDVDGHDRRRRNSSRDGAGPCWIVQLASMYQRPRAGSRLIHTRRRPRRRHHPTRPAPPHPPRPTARSNDLHPPRAARLRASTTCAGSGCTPGRDPKSPFEESGLKAPMRRAERLDRADCRRSVRREAVHEPRRRSGRWCAVLGRERIASVIGPGLPAPAAQRAAMAVTISGSVTLRASPSATRSNSRVATLSVQRGSRARFFPLRVASPVWNQKAPSVQRPPMPVTCGLPSRLIVANQHVWRSGPPVCGAWVRPSARRAAIRVQSSRGAP